MADIYDVYMRGDIEVSVSDFWDGCGSRERDELRDILVGEYKINVSDSLDMAVIRLVGSLAEGNEAKDYIRKVAADLEWKLRNRDFS